MGIRIISPGKIKQDFINQGVQKYLKRLSPYTKINLMEIPDVKLTSSNNIDIVKKKEAEIIEKYLKGNEYLIALDERGVQFSSIDFSNRLENKLSANIVFVIGGVYGLDERIKKKADLLLGFSSMTFTHQMIRMILIEQIYRAFTIIKGKKYHY